VVAGYTDKELARLVRYDVKRDGRSAVGMRAGVLWPLGEQGRSKLPRYMSLSARKKFSTVTGR
jgi:hypothetical protein